MNIEDLQAYVVDRLKGSTDLAGVTVVAHDGSDTFLDDSKARAEALASSGLCLTVWQPEPDGLMDNGDGVPAFRVGIAVVIEENASAARRAQDGGFEITAFRALRFVMEAVIGVVPAEQAFGRALTLDDPPFENFGTVRGVHRLAALFVVPIQVQPTNP